MSIPRCGPSLFTQIFFILLHLQNLLYRLVKERKDAVHKKVAEASAAAGSASSSEESPPADSDKDGKTTEEILLENQPVFTAHAEPNTRLKPVNIRELDPRELHHVVVPYSQLRHQRMYDWPPEPQYARVKIRQPELPITTSQKRKNYAGISEAPLAEGNVPVRRNRTYSGHRRASSAVCVGDITTSSLARAPSGSPNSKKKGE